MLPVLITSLALLSSCSPGRTELLYIMDPVYADLTAEAYQDVRKEARRAGVELTFLVYADVPLNLPERNNAGYEGAEKILDEIRDLSPEDRVLISPLLSNLLLADVQEPDPVTAALRQIPAEQVIVWVPDASAAAGSGHPRIVRSRTEAWLLAGSFVRSSETQAAFISLEGDVLAEQYAGAFLPAVFQAEHYRVSRRSGTQELRSLVNRLSGSGTETVAIYAGELTPVILELVLERGMRPIAEFASASAAAAGAAAIIEDTASVLLHVFELAAQNSSSGRGGEPAVLSTVWKIIPAQEGVL